MTLEETGCVKLSQRSGVALVRNFNFSSGASFRHASTLLALPATVGDRALSHREVETVNCSPIRFGCPLSGYGHQIRASLAKQTNERKES
jgi:hypothetical protein